MVSVPPQYYSPGHSRKKKAIQMVSLMEIFIGVVALYSVSRAWMMINMGGGRTLVGGEPDFA